MSIYYDWEHAEAMYKLGKSSREIGRVLNIPHATVRRRANAEKWIKGELIPLVWGKVRLIEMLKGCSRCAFELIMQSLIDDAVANGKPIPYDTIYSFRRAYYGE